ncbi:MAG: Gfo/Idh/MocA family protein [Nitrospinota bacterium]
MRKIRAGIVGLGKWAESIAAAVARGDAVELVACTSSSNPDKAREFGERHSCKPFDTYEAMLADPSIEAVLITSANHQHADHAVSAAQAKKPAFVEKPISTTIPDAHRVIEECARAGVVLSTGQMTRRMTGVRKMKALAEEGTLGEVVMSEANFSSPTGYTVTPDNWRYSNDTCPGGPLMQLGVHTADALAYLLGDIDRIQAAARRAVVETEIDTLTGTLIEFRSGAIGYLGSNFVSAPLFYLNLHGTEANANFSVMSDAFPWSRTDQLDENSVLEIHKRGSAERETIPLRGGDVLREELEEFARCIREGGTPEVGGWEGLVALGVVLASFGAAHSGQAIDFPKFIQ